MAESVRRSRVQQSLQSFNDVISVITSLVNLGQLTCRLNDVNKMFEVRPIIKPNAFEYSNHNDVHDVLSNAK